VTGTTDVLVGVEFLSRLVGEGVEGAGHGAVAVGLLVEDHDAGGFVFGDELVVLGLR